MADGLALSLNARVLRFTLHAVAGRMRRRFVTLPAAGPAGTFPTDSLASFERLAGSSGWRNEVVTDLDYPMPLYRPYRRAGRIEARVLIQLGEHDRFAAKRAPRGELKRYPIDHFSCFWPEHVDEVAGDQIDFLNG